MAAYRRVNIEISNICNLQCSFCPEVDRQKQVMTPEAFAQLAAQLPGQVDEVCLHLMGEPLLHPQFESIVELCEAHQLPINLTTNGMLLNRDRRELALRKIVRQVNISVHSFEANFGAQDNAAYLQRVFRLTREALTRRPELYINLRLWDLQGPGQMSPQNADLRRQIEAEFGVAIDTQAVDIRRKKNLCLRGRVYLHFDSRFVWPSPALPVRTQTGFCHGLSNHFGVHADGTVVPCCLDKEAVIPLGNVLEQSLESILQGPRAAAMREGFARGELVEDLCQRCPFITRFDKKARRLAHEHKAQNPALASRRRAESGAPLKTD